MKLQFSATQDYQLEAVKSVIDIFEGQPLAKGDFEVSFAMEGASIAYTEKGIGNNLVLTESQILQNIQTIQARNNIAISESLVASYSEDKKTEYNRLNFTIEMETGTGKTYTFLRTIYELNKVYGFKKFVIVVPKVAIREGTLKNLEITHEHFQSLYECPPINYVMYDSKNLTSLKNFATSNAIQILVINIDSFNKDSNIINTTRETGVKPIEYIQSTLPIVIVDEPQNMEKDPAVKAIHSLNPLCTFRYSATHLNLYNLLYSLNPVQAYDLGLVKQIEVDGITSDSNYNAAFIQVKKIEAGKKTLKVKLAIYVNDKGGVSQKDLAIALGDDLFAKSNGRDIYKDGFILNEIRVSDREIEFANGIILKEGETQGGLTDEVMKFQIERTVQTHFEKVKKLKPQGIKVLSLFFIDRVANYRNYTADGNPEQGKFAIWFEEAFAKQSAKKSNQDLIPFNIAQVHNGYFASDKLGKGKDKKDIWIDSKENNTKKDDDTYSLIMQEKERLLSLDEPLQFIFSHSALREGWDNPNVFQICTLNESKSKLRKRQEIGRGLRLAVNSEGQRVQDKQVNVLTVMANETYEEFSLGLQNEIEEDTSVKFEGRIKNARAKAQIEATKELTLENFPLLFEIWEKISHKTRYSVNYDTEDLIDKTVAELQNFNQVPLTKRPLLESKTVRLDVTNQGIEGVLQNTSIKYADEIRYQIPDVYGYIQSKVDLTRNTIFEILKRCDRYHELEINPQMFLDHVVAAIKRNLNSLLIAGIRYERINGQRYEMQLFELEEIETYLDGLFTVSRTDKTVFNYIQIDGGSNIEREFAKDCEADEKVKFFFKIPKSFFKIPTPIGTYTPDWAVIFDHEDCSRIYFVAETKGTLDHQALRELEKMKINCGEKHFALFEPLGVKYQLAVTTRDLY